MVCCEHIVNNVDLKWTLPDCSGKATLEGIRLTPGMVQLVTVSPIEWGTSIFYRDLKYRNELLLSTWKVYVE
jgi:hypothetical protein